MKNIAGGVLLSTLAVTAAEAQGNPRVAPPAVYDVAPGLAHFTDDVLFGEVWKRSGISARDRSLVTITVLISTGKTPQIATHVRRALDNGLTPAEVGETITQLAFYTGWPNAISAALEVKKVFDERGIGPVAINEASPIQLEQRSETARQAAIDDRVASTAPALADLTNRVLFGDLWRRPDLSTRDRSLVTTAALIAIGQPEQLPFHASRALDNGVTKAEMDEVVTQVAFYAGWPRAMSAVPVLQRLYESRQAPAKSDGSGAN